MKKTILFIILTIFIINNSVFAGPGNKYGLSAARELMIPVGSISTSLGGSNLATVSGLDALYWNPSGLANIGSKTGEALFSNQIYIAGINVNYFAGAYKVPNIGTIAIAVKSLNFGYIGVTTVASPDGNGETYSPTFLTTGISYARNMTDRISFGTTINLLYEEISRESAKGIAFNFGLQYNVIGSGLQFGVALKNLGPNMVFTGPDLEQYYHPTGTPVGTPAQPRSIELSNFELPSALCLGLSYNIPMDKKNSLVAHGTYQNNSFSTDNYNFGLEYNYSKLVFLRGGYQVGSDNVSEEIFTGPSFGAGFNYNASTSFSVGFDYAYRVTDKFDANQYFTIRLGF